MEDKFEKVFLNKYGYYELRNKPSLSDRKKEFEEEYYQKSESTYEQSYSEEELRFINNKLEQKQLIIERNMNRPVKGMSIIDIGCGEGFVMKYFHDRGMEVTGIDFSDWAVSHHNPDMLPFLCKGDCAEILPEMIEAGLGFDVINIDSALDMMLEPGKIIGLCKRLLNDGGIMIIKVANNYSLLQQSLLATGQLANEYWLDDPGHPSYFNRDGLQCFMAEQGFRCVDFYGESFIDFNLLNPRTNYYENPEAGKDIYRAKLQLENMMHDISPKKALDVFRTLGEMGFGREIIGVFRAL